MEIIEKVTSRQIISESVEDNLAKLRYFDKMTNVTALILGKLLKENVDNRYFEKLGYESFTDFIGDSQFSFGQRTAYNYIYLWDIYEEYQIEYERFVKVPYSKMLKIKRVIDRDNLEKWLKKAETLSRNDLEIEVREVLVNEGKREEDDGYKELPNIYICPDCRGFVIDCELKDLCICGKGLTKQL